MLVYSSAERTPVSKHISAKEDISARSSGTACPTPEFRMSVLLARDEHSGSQKELHNRSPAMRTKSVHSRDKSGLRARDTLRLVNEKQPVSLYEVHYFHSFLKIFTILNLYSNVSNVHYCLFHGVDFLQASNIKFWFG